jgi:acyl carrier protein
MTPEARRALTDAHDRALAEIRRVLVTKLKVQLPVEQIDLDAPLFGTGLGLDSVDAVELVVAIESELGVKMPESQAGPWAFRTVHSLVDYVVTARAAAPTEGQA